MDVDLRRLEGDVVGGQVGVDVEVEPHRRLGRRPRLALRAQLLDRLVEQGDVELEADRGDVAGLLVAEQVARPAQLEVAHRDREAGAELGVVGERRQALARPRG